MDQHIKSLLIRKGFEKVRREEYKRGGICIDHFDKDYYVEIPGSSMKKITEADILYPLSIDETQLIIDDRLIKDPFEAYLEILFEKFSEHISIPHVDIEIISEMRVEDKSSLRKLATFALDFVTTVNVESQSIDAILRRCDQFSKDTDDDDWIEYFSGHLNTEVQVNHDTGSIKIDGSKYEIKDAFEYLFNLIYKWQRE